MLLDKREVLQKLPGMEKVVLEFGCGPKKARSESIAIDFIDYPCVDIVGDAMEFLRKLPDSSVDEITSSHFLEHIPDFKLFLTESCRVLKSGALFDATVPHFSNPYYYSDLTHKTPFGLYTLSYFVHDGIFRRAVPAYSERLPMNLVFVDLVFNSYSKRNVRHWVKKIFQIVFNSSIFMKEFYEENLCFLFPCYELHFQVKKS